MHVHNLAFQACQDTLVFLRHILLIIELNRCGCGHGIILTGNRIGFSISDSYSCMAANKKTIQKSKGMSNNRFQYALTDVL